MTMIHIVSPRTNTLQLKANESKKMKPNIPRQQENVETFAQKYDTTSFDTTLSFGVESYKTPQHEVIRECAISLNPPLPPMRYQLDGNVIGKIYPKTECRWPQRVLH
uniref:Uncharacterized protein n=1 Tax=Corethron hystrix TaxID=216773 RepID=A0A7S1BN44_9STRA|mmetsp:Transcript_32864/g.75622  ORF Transcript_32864/g.75622 Transcript_32864/m.75622 type:complete len:107 (+) Transcript_32864:346-666(+)